MVAKGRVVEIVSVVCSRRQGDGVGLGNGTGLGWNMISHRSSRLSNNHTVDLHSNCVSGELGVALVARERGHHASITASHINLRLVIDA
jgi:hypothetical protein